MRWAKRCGWDANEAMSNSPQTIEQFVRELFEDGWKHSPIKPLCQEFMRGRNEQLRLYPAADIVVHACEAYHRDALALLLSAPELWENFSVGDWRSIMARLSPRPGIEFGDWPGRFADVAFLTTYLQVDAIALAGTLPVAEQIQICRFCQGSTESHSLFLEDSDVEDLDGVILCTPQELERARDRLVLEDGSLKPCYGNQEELVEYASGTLLRLRGDLGT